MVRVVDAAVRVVEAASVERGEEGEGDCVAAAKVEAEGWSGAVGVALRECAAADDDDAATPMPPRGGGEGGAAKGEGEGVRVELLLSSEPFVATPVGALAGRAGAGRVAAEARGRRTGGGGEASQDEAAALPSNAA